MKKTVKWGAIVLALALLLTACGSAPAASTTPTTTAPAETTVPVETTTAPPETTAPPVVSTPQTVCEIGRSTVTAGNLVLPIPEGYTAQMVNENTILLMSPDGNCGISIFAADISELDEASAMLYIPMQQESFYADDGVQSEIETFGPYTVGGFDVNWDIYTEILTDLSMYSVLSTTFTDSWFGYTILLKTMETNCEDYATAYGIMLLKATYTGPAPRFDFVQ